MASVQEDIIDWHTEATAVIKDVKEHVKHIAISENLITGSSSFIVWNFVIYDFVSQDVGIYINLQTLEGKELTCFLDGSGFKIVGDGLDSCDNEDNSEETFETIYALIQVPKVIPPGSQWIQAANSSSSLSENISINQISHFNNLPHPEPLASLHRVIRQRFSGQTQQAFMSYS